MKILTRYILREHLGPLMFALTALTSLLLLNQIAKRFGDLVGKGLSWAVIGKFFLLSLPFIVTMTIPMAVLVAVLYAFSRLASENEVTALRASGIGIVRLILPPLWGGLFMSLVMLGFNDQVLPRTNHELRILEADIAKKKPTFALREQVINEVSPGKLYLRAGRIDQESDKLHEITIYDMGDPMHRRTVNADSGTMGLSPDQQDLEMTLFNGYSEEMPKDKPGELQRVFFTRDRVRVKGVSNQFQQTGNDEYKSEREMSVCEMTLAYNQGMGALDIAKRSLYETTLAATERAATGESHVMADTATPKRHLSLGLIYCDYMLGALGLGSSIVKPQRPPVPLPTPITTPTATTPGSTNTPAPAQNATSTSLVPPSTGATANKVNKANQVNQVTAQVTKDSAPHVAIIPQGSKPAPPPTPILAPSTGVTVLPPMGPHIVEAPGSAIRGDKSVMSAISQFEAIRGRVFDAQQTVNRYDTQIHKMFALAAACVVFVLLGAPIALRFPRGGVGLVIGVSLAVFSIYYVGLIAGETLAQNLYVPPAVAMWIANFILGVVGLVFLARVSKSGATARGGDVSEMLDSIRTWFRRLRTRLHLGGERRTARSEA